MNIINIYNILLISFLYQWTKNYTNIFNTFINKNNIYVIVFLYN